MEHSGRKWIRMALDCASFRRRMLQKTV